MLDAASAATSKLDTIPWNSSFELGIATIDEQHRQLVGLLNKLAHECAYGGERSEIERLLNALLEDADYHFATEEALWAEVAVANPWYKDHAQSHQRLVSKVLEVQSKLATGDASTQLDKFLPFLASWLAHHILYESKRCSLLLLQLRVGIDVDVAKQRVEELMAKQASVLMQKVLAMYQELSSHILALQHGTRSRQIAEHPLSEQEQHWHSLLGDSNDYLWEFILNDDQQMEQQISPEQFVQDDCKVHPDEWPALRQEFLAHLLDQREVFLHQYRVIDAAGNERWVQSQGKTIERDSAGRPKRIVGTQIDVTERKNAELTLQRERDTRMLISEFAADFMASSAQEFDAAIDLALQRSCEYMQADRSYVFLISADGQSISNTHEWCAAGIQAEMDKLQNIPISQLAWWLGQLRDKGSITVQNLNDMPSEAHSEYYLLQMQGICSVCAYPLFVENQLIGFVGSDSVAKQRRWNSESIEFLSLMADLLGIAFGHRQLEQKREQAISVLERAEQLAQIGHWGIDYALQTMVCSQQVFRIFELDSTAVIPSLETYIELVHPDDRASVSHAYQQAKALLSDLHLEHRILLSGSRVKHLELRGQFSATAEGQPARFEGTIQDVTEIVQQRESLQRLAFQDSLTGLPNRRSIEETLLHEMQYCERHNRRLALALLDLDNFRETNERYGAALGDTLLKSLAQRLQRLYNNNVIVARVGGDEFVVLFTRLKPEDSYYQQLNRLLAVISQPLHVDGIEVVLTSSIGVTEYPQPIEVVSEQLLRQAQQALFQAKMLGKSRFQRYDIRTERDARELTDHLEQISHALQSGELVLYYQPKVNMKTGAVLGVEALLRWQKSTGELVAPGDFLPALHNQPLEVELGDWVIRTALAQMQAWKQQGLDIEVSVNVSSQQLFDVTFVEKLSIDLQRFPDISPSALQLEVLESSMLRDLEAVSEVMLRCRKLGVGFALDDFGTGYSSLTYLKHLPADVLKVDRSFVEDMLENADDLSIISGIIGMANAFGMQVIAEGVESEEQGSMLLRLGCELAQGYGIALPLPACEVPEWVNAWPATPSWLGQQPVEVRNLPLLYAEVEHRYWVLKLADWVCGECDTGPLLSHKDCKLGIWLASDAQSRFKDHPQLPKVLEVHRTLHNLGEQVVSLHAKGDSEAALLLLPQIERQRDLFFVELRALMD